MARNRQTGRGRMVVRPLQALSRMARRPGRRSPGPVTPAPLTPGRYDWWLQNAQGERLSEIDGLCAGGEPKCMSLFRELDPDLWALLLTQDYEVYPNIRRVLPDVPDRALQETWNGTSGAELAAQSVAFYRVLRRRFDWHSDRSLNEATVLDFGCGWGRLTRFLARDVEPGRLYGCDPVEPILEVCRENGVPATLARSDFQPERLPFDTRFDLAYAFSVFTHLSEAAHERCLAALHESIRPGGILVLTIRPPEYLRFSDRMRPLLSALGSDPHARLEEPRYLFAPHPVEPTHLQYDGGEMTYGESVVTLSYVREHWAPAFELVDVDLLVGDLHQLVLTLRRR